MSDQIQIAKPKGRVAKAAANVQRKEQAKTARAEQSNSSISFLKTIKGGQVQAKLKIGSPNDMFEKEADQMAEKVMRMPGSVAQDLHNEPASLGVSQEGSLQRTEDKDDKDSIEIQRKESTGTRTFETPVQSKDAGAKGDTKQESLRGRVTQMKVLRPSLAQGHINRREDEEIQTKTDSDVSRGPPGGSFSSKLNQSRGCGRPMDSDTQSFMNTRFGADFSNVRIHTGSDAKSMSNSINAKAFTNQNNIYFNEGQYQPDTTAGKTLLAHELTHTIQQGAVNGQIQAKLKVGAPNDLHEREADTMAAAVMRIPEEKIQRKCSVCEKEENVQRSVLDRGPPFIQRMAFSAWEKEYPNELIQTERNTSLLRNDILQRQGDFASEDTEIGNVDSEFSEEEAEAYEQIQEEALGVSSETAIGGDCLDIVTPVTEWLKGAGRMEDGSRAPREDEGFFDQLLSYAPTVLMGPIALLGRGAMEAFELLPDEVKSTIIDDAIDHTITVAGFIPEISFTDKYGKIVFITFLGELKKEAYETKIGILRKVMDIVTGKDIIYFFGMAKGLVAGFFADGILGLVQMVIDIICLIPQMFSFVDMILEFIGEFPDTIRDTIASMDELREAIDEAMESAYDDIMSLLSDPQKLFELIEGIDEQISSFAEKIGKEGAKIFLQVYAIPAHDMGFAVGRVLGMIIWEIVFSIIGAALTAYIGGAGAGATAVTSAGKVVVRVIAKFIKTITKMIRPILKFIITKLDDLIGFVKGIAKLLPGKMGNAGSKMGRFMEKIKELFQDFIDLIKRKRRRRRADDDDDDDTGDGLKWRSFKTQIRALPARYGSDGVSRINLEREVVRIKNTVNTATNKVVVSTDIDMEDGKWLIQARKKGRLYKNDIDTVWMTSAERWERGKTAIKAEIRNIRDNNRNVQGVEREIRGYKERFGYSRLRVVEDTQEDDFNILGAMSPEREVAEVDKKLPHTRINFGGLNPGGFGTHMRADPLTKNGPRGTRPSVSNINWDKLVRRYTKPSRGRSWYARGHLLNHNIHGTGASWQNLTPITQTSNGRHLREVERAVKAAVDSGGILRYEVVARNTAMLNTTLIRRIEQENLPPELKQAKIDVVTAEQFVPLQFDCTVTEYDSASDYTSRTGGKTWSKSIATFEASHRTSDIIIRNERSMLRGWSAPQPKLKSGLQNTLEERQADDMANSIMNPEQSDLELRGNVIEPLNTVQRKCSSCEREEKVQRKCAKCKKEEELLQRSLSSYSGGSTVSKSFQNQLNLTRGRGRPIGKPVRKFMENRFGKDFSDVNIHTGADANRLSKQINAKAFTVGNDIYFNQGEYNPDTSVGKHLLAHELTHTLQQTDKVRRTEDDNDFYQDDDSVEFEVADDAVYDQDAEYSDEYDDEYIDEYVPYTCTQMNTLFYSLIHANLQNVLLYDMDVHDFMDDLKADVNANDYELNASQKSSVLDCVNNLDDVTTKLFEDKDDLNYVNSILWLGQYLGVPQEVLEVGGQRSYGTQYFIHQISRDIAGYMTGAIANDLTPEEVECVNYSLSDIKGYFVDYVDSWGTSDGLIELEFIGGMDHLYQLRVDFSDPDKEDQKIEIGKEIGTLSRELLMLDQQLVLLRGRLEVGEREYASGQSELERYLENNSSRIEQIKVDAETEEDTFRVLNNEHTLLKDNVLMQIPDSSFQTDHDRVVINPDSAFPEATDDATLKMMAELAERIEAQQEKVADLKASIIPSSPLYSIDEFKKVYNNWFTFFSPAGRDMNPIFKETDALITKIYGIFGMAGAEGGLGRWMLIQNIVGSGFLDYLGSADSKSFAEVVEAQSLGREEVVSGTATDIQYGYGEMYSGESQALTFAGELASVQETLLREKSDSVRGFNDLRRMGEQGESGARISRAAREHGLELNGVQAPIYLLPEEKHQDLWSYLVTTSNHSAGGDRSAVQEQQTISPELSEYLLTTAQFYRTLDDNHMPGVGDANTRQSGIEEGTASNRSDYLEAGVENDSVRRATALREEISGARRGVGLEGTQSVERIATERIIADLEIYLNEYFNQNEEVVEKLFGVLMIGIKEHRGDESFLRHFTASSLFDVLLLISGIIALTSALRLVPYIGPVLSMTVGKMIRRYGLASDVGDIIAISGFIHETENAESFYSARRYGYASKFIMGDLGLLVQGVAVGAGVSVFHIARGIRRTASHPSVDEVMRDLDPILRDPEFSMELRNDLASRKEFLSREGVDNSNPELELINEIILRIDGGPRPNRAITPEPMRADIQVSDSLVKADTSLVIRGERHGMSITMNDGRLVVRICSKCDRLVSALDFALELPMVRENPAITQALREIRVDAEALSLRVNGIRYRMRKAKPEMEALMRRLREVGETHPEVLDAIFNRTSAVHAEPTVSEKLTELSDAFRIVENRPRPLMGNGNRQTHRSTLRGRMKKDPNLPGWAINNPKKWEAHHIIPWEMLEKHPSFEVLRSNGVHWDHNSISNGIALPKVDGIQGASHLPLHQMNTYDTRGHPIYNERVKGDLDMAYMRYQEHRNPEFLAEDIISLQSALRAEIEGGHWRTVLF